MSLLLTEDQVKKLIDMPLALDKIRQAYRECSDGLIFYSDRITLEVRGKDNSCIWLPACYSNKPYFGVKYAASFPSNASKGKPTVISQISIYSADTGELLGIVSANYLTAIKTGGSSGVATDLMARKDATKLGIIGTGTQAFTQLLSIQEVRPLTEVRIFDLDKNRVKAFIEQAKSAQNREYSLISVDSSNECVAKSDIVCTCTPSNTPVFDSSSLHAGIHVNAIGSFTPFMQEIEEETVLKSSKLITEHVDEMWKVAGDILTPFNNGLITKDKCTGSVGDVLTGKVIGRENNEEITLYESNGSGVLDLALAVAVYEEAQKH